MTPARVAGKRRPAGSKRTAASKGRKRPAPRSGPTARSPRPFLRFYHSGALRSRTLSLLDTLEQANDPAAHRDALADVVVELTNTGMDCYFMKPLKLARTGFILQQSAKIGMAGVQQVMASVIRRIIGGMEGPQLLSVCGSIRQFML